MRKITILAALLVSTTAIAQTTVEKRIRLAMTCFSSGEQESDRTKICFYDCLGSQVAITVSSVSLCPLSIRR